MNLLSFVKRRKDNGAFVQRLRDHSIKITGPYRTPKGTRIYILFGCVVMERELLDLENAGKLDAAGVSDLTAGIMKHGA